MPCPGEPNGQASSFGVCPFLSRGAERKEARTDNPRGSASADPSFFLVYLLVCLRFPRNAARRRRCTRSVRPRRRTRRRSGRRRRVGGRDAHPTHDPPVAVVIIADFEVVERKSLRSVGPRDQPDGRRARLFRIPASGRLARRVAKSVDSGVGRTVAGGRNGLLLAAPGGWSPHVGFRTNHEPFDAR